MIFIPVGVFENVLLKWDVRKFWFRRNFVCCITIDLYGWSTFSKYVTSNTGLLLCSVKDIYKPHEVLSGCNNIFVELLDICALRLFTVVHSPEHSLLVPLFSPTLNTLSSYKKIIF